MQHRVAPVHRVGFIELPGSSSWRKKYSIYPEPSSSRIVPLSNFVSPSELPLSIGQMLLPFWQDRKFSLIPFRVFRYGSTFFYHEVYYSFEDNIIYRNNALKHVRICFEFFYLCIIRVLLWVRFRTIWILT